MHKVLLPFNKALLRGNPIAKINKPIKEGVRCFMMEVSVYQGMNGLALYLFSC